MSLIETEPNLNTSVAEWAMREPSVADAFDHLGIPYCCEGCVSLEEACWQRGLDAPLVLEQLREIGESLHGEGDSKWTAAPLGELCGHIERVHHAYLRDELAAIADLVARVTRVHAASHPELRRLEEAFGRMASLLALHLFKEEQVLFSMIRQRQRGGPPQLDAVRHAVRVLEAEHERIRASLAVLRTLTDGYRLPQDACLSYVLMLHRLEHFEREMHHHVHKENNILFPRTCQP